MIPRTTMSTLLRPFYVIMFMIILVSIIQVNGSSNPTSPLPRSSSDLFRNNRPCYFVCLGTRCLRLVKSDPESYPDCRTRCAWKCMELKYGFGYYSKSTRKRPLVSSKVMLQELV